MSIGFRVKGIAMADSEKPVLFEGGLDEYPIGTVIAGNVVMLAWIAIGTVCCYFFNKIAAWMYLGVALLLVYVVLRRLVCVNCCYYGKRCSAGWGKLSAAMFKQGRIEDFNDSMGTTLAPAVYGLLTLLPLVLGTIAAVQHFSAIKPAFLAALLLLGVYSGAISRKRACSRCRMRGYCKGCAATAP